MKKDIPLFKELQLLFNSGKITELENKHKTGRSSRKFGFKEQLFFMLFYIYSQSKSMRDAIRLINRSSDWNACKNFGKFSKSSIADANGGFSFLAQQRRGLKVLPCGYKNKLQKISPWFTLA